MKGVSQRLDFLMRGLADNQRKVLCALALEGGLSHPALQRAIAALCPEPIPSSRPAGGAGQRLPVGTANWIRRAVDARLLVDAPWVRSLSGARDGGLAVHPEFEQLVLRRAAASGQLTEIAQVTHSIMGERSRAPFVVLLQVGELSEFQRHAMAFSRAASLSVPSQEPSDQLLRATICRPFDAPWFEATFGAEALGAAQSVLSDALGDLYECDALFRWTAAHLGAGAAGRGALGELPPGLFQTLCEHALLRDRPDVIEEVLALGALASHRAEVFALAAHVLHGEMSDAEACLDRLSEEASPGARPSARPPLPEAGGVTPLILLMLLSRKTNEGSAVARRWLSSRQADCGAALARALRTLLRYVSQPEGEAVRLDVHQLANGAGCWELLVLGLAAELSGQNEVTRAGWAKHLVATGVGWIESGYRWVGRQALFLARRLHPEYFESELSPHAQSLFPEGLSARAGELILAHRVEAQPRWRRGLQALETIALEARETAIGARRVAWHVNMVHGTLERPALQELRGSGWTQGRRVSVNRLREVAGELPVEDQRVLALAEPVAGDRWELPAAAMEALIGHPRVMDGIAARRVEVVRGECRVRTAQRGESLVVFVDPPGLQPGANVVVEGPARIAVIVVTAEMQRVMQTLSEPLEIPAEHHGEALSVIGKLSHGVEVDSPHLGQERDVEPDAAPRVRIWPSAGAWLVQAGVRPFGEGGRFFLPGVGRSLVSFYHRGEKLRSTRDFRRERALCSDLIQSCPSLLERTVGDFEVRSEWQETQLWDFDEQGLLELMVELRDADVPHSLEWPEGDGQRLAGSASSSSLKCTLRRRKGWYLLGGTAVLDSGVEIPLAELVAAPVVGRGRFVRLASGDLVEIEARIRRVMNALAATTPARGSPRELQLHPGALGALEELGSLGVGFSPDAESADWLRRVSEARSRQFAPPEHLEATLRGYQREGFRWLSALCELELGACLADDMGLGKTLQILALLSTRIGKGPMLVVAPTSVCSNWKFEAERFAPMLRCQEYVGPGRAKLLEAWLDPSGGEADFDLLITSYGLLQQDDESFARVQWEAVVLDEAQFIKNPGALRAKAARGLSARCRIAATGTPVENHLGDLWSVFEFLNPGLLGSWRAFNNRFVKPVARDGNEGAKRALSQLVRPFLLRRTKAEVLRDLPPLTTVRHEVRLEEAEQAQYDLLRRQIQEKLHTAHGKRHSKLEILAEITRLRRFCCHPGLVFPEAPREAAKIDAFVLLAQELREGGHRALVFSQFVDFLEIVRQRLDETGVRYQYLDGSTPRQERTRQVSDFQAGEGDLFLISLKAGGFGLNLTGADYVIHLDPWWNPAVESQATDRAHRIGQERPVTVYRLVTRGTIEESIVELHDAKRALADSLLADSEGGGKLSVAELLGLIDTGLGPALVAPQAFVNPPATPQG